MAVNRLYHGKGFHLAHLNVRSMFGGHKLDLLKQQISNSGVDVFTLSETWLNAAIPDRLIETSSYNVCRLDRNWSEIESENSTPKRGGGLACFVRAGVKFSDTKFGNLNISNTNLEMQWVTIDLERVRPIIIVNIYRPPQGNYKTACKLINEAFEKASLKSNAEIFILGDFNINFKDTTSLAFKELNFTMRSLGMSQLIKEPTRPSHRNGQDTSSLIDLIFTNSDSISNTKLLDINISDHLAIMTTRKKSYVKPAKIEFSSRTYRNYDREHFQDLLINHNWENFYSQEDPNVLWDYLSSVIIATINPMCPIKKFKVPEAKEPWIMNEAIEAIRDKDNLLKRDRKSKLPRDWEAAKRVRNNVGRQVENLRIDYLKNQQVAHQSDPKKFWNTISSIIPSKNSHLNL